MFQCFVRMSPPGLDAASKVPMTRSTEVPSSAIGLGVKRVVLSLESASL